MFDDEQSAVLTGRQNAYLATLMPDGSPQVTPVWVDVDGGDLLFSTTEGTVKLANLRRDPRVVVSFQAKEFEGQGLWPYVVIEGRARITEGGALEVMDRLAEAYLGPGQRFWLRDVPDGVVVHIEIERIYGVGPWSEEPATT